MTTTKSDWTLRAAYVVALISYLIEIVICILDRDYELLLWVLLGFVWCISAGWSYSRMRVLERNNG